MNFVHDNVEEFADPAFSQSNDTRWMELREAHRALHPMYWGSRLSVEEATTTIRDWIASELS